MNCPHNRIRYSDRAWWCANGRCGEQIAARPDGPRPTPDGYLLSASDVREANRIQLLNRSGPCDNDSGQGALW